MFFQKHYKFLYYFIPNNLFPPNAYFQNSSQLQHLELGLQFHGLILSITNMGKRSKRNNQKEICNTTFVISSLPACANNQSKSKVKVKIKIKIHLMGDWIVMKRITGPPYDNLRERMNALRKVNLSF